MAAPTDTDRGPDPACPTARLNPGQQAAAQVGSGAHLVLAGPGTGKTTTLVARFIHLVRSGVPADRILAITFTRKAADAMRARISQALDNSPEPHTTEPEWIPDRPALSVGTFHALSARLLRDLMPTGRLSPGFTIADTRASRSILHDKRLYWDEDEDLLDIIGGAKERLMDPDDFSDATTIWIAQGIRPAYYGEAARRYHIYQQELESRNWADFGDLVMKLVMGLDDNPTMAERISARYDHVLVDEYQDVNPAQIALIDRLITAHGNLWAVGDDDQCLYAFRAATPEFILSFQDRHPDSETHTLSENYRSTPEILSAATQLIAANRARRAKPLTSVRPSENRAIRFVDHADSQTEADAIADWFRRLITAGARPSEMAVLCRVSALTIPIQGALRRVGLPFVVRGSGDLWNATETRAFTGMLLIAADPEDPRGHDLLGLRAGRSGSKRSEALAQQAKDLSDLAFGDRIEKAAEAVKAHLPRWKGTEYKLAWSENVEAARTLAAACTDGNGVLAMIEEQKQALRAAETDDAIVLSTIHAAKGLEWPRVAVIGLEDGILPHQAALDDGDVEEERRILYVALTRAQNVLILSRAAERGGRKTTAPSRFLEEAGHPPFPKPKHTGATKQSRKTSEGGVSRAASKGSSRAGAAWTKEEEETLRTAFAAGEDLGSLAARMGRGRGALWIRLTRMGLVSGSGSGSGGGRA